jgi:hypothetical protein
MKRLHSFVCFLLFAIAFACSPASSDAMAEREQPGSHTAENASRVATFPATAAEAGSVVLQVDAGAYDRRGTIVSFLFPFAVDPGVYPLTDESGHVNQLQVDQANSGWFVLDELSAGATAKFTLDVRPAARQPAAGQGTGQVSSQMDDATVTFSAGGSKVLSYYHRENSPPDELDERYRRGGYIHPFYSPGGVVLTSHMNVDQHPHHSGIWSAWTRTQFEGRNPDFWNVHQDRGRVDVDSLIAKWEGPVFGGFRSAHRFTDLSGEEPVTALNEIWDVKVYASPLGGQAHVFDLTVTQTVNSDRPLLLPEYRYGGIGFRGHIDWNDPEKCFFLTSGGLGRDGHGTRAKWVHMGGYSEDELAGFAILGHPSNYRFPQTMRIHPREPFFNYAPTQLGDMSIQPGIPFITRYRIVTHDGGPDAGLIDRLWLDYAYPPSVTITSH